MSSSIGTVDNNKSICLNDIKISSYSYTVWKKNQKQKQKTGTGTPVNTLEIT